MKRFVGFLFLGLFLTSCERVPLDYVEPATQRLDNYTRYSCQYTGNNSWRNAETSYWHWDLSFSKGKVYIQYANIYTGRPSTTGTFYNISRADNEKVTVRGKNSKHDSHFFYGTNGNLIYKGKIWGNCFKVEGPEQKVANWNKVKTKTSKKTAKAKPSSKSSEGSSGSGFFINNKGYVITNHHVVEGCRSTPKIMYDDNPVNAKLVAKDKYLDLALLKTNLRNTTYIPLSKDPPRKLQRIIAAGYPFGKYVSDDMKFTSGIVSSLKGIGDDSTRLQIDAALNPGNSGGPIINEETGELVAVAVAGLRKDKTEAVNFGIKTVSLKNFLESNQIDTRTFTKKYSRESIASLLEKSTLYTFCK